MSNMIGIMGPSGFGKSTSLIPNEEIGIKGLNPEETIIINVTGQPLPGAGINKLYPVGLKPTEGGRHFHEKDPFRIASLLKFIDEKLPNIKNVVIEDAGYIMGFDVIDNANNKSFDKWTNLAVNFMKVINAAREMRHDVNVIFLFHIEMGKDERLKIKTSGAMLDNNIYLDGLFTVLLESGVVKEGDSLKYGFFTHSDGTSTRKSPVGMFKEDFILNDMGEALNIINNYYNN